MSEPISGQYLGMTLQIDANDEDNLSYFRYCAQGEFRLQCCASCQLLRYPPTSACPWCGHEHASWQSVSGRGTVFSYAEVHHAIQPAFKTHLPYLILIVELDDQKDQPNKHDGLRIAGNLATADGELAPAELVEQVGIGSRVRMLYKPVSEGLAVPLWVLDKEVEQPASVWRYSP